MKQVTRLIRLPKLLAISLHPSMHMSLAIVGKQQFVKKIVCSKFTVFMKHSLVHIQWILHSHARGFVNGSEAS